MKQEHGTVISFKRPILHNLYNGYNNHWSKNQSMCFFSNPNYKFVDYKITNLGYKFVCFPKPHHDFHMPCRTLKIFYCNDIPIALKLLQYYYNCNSKFLECNETDQ